MSGPADIQYAAPLLVAVERRQDPSSPSKHLLQARHDYPVLKRDDHGPEPSITTSSTARKTSSATSSVASKSSSNSEPRPKKTSTASITATASLTTSPTASITSVASTSTSTSTTTAAVTSAQLSPLDKLSLPTQGLIILGATMAVILEQLIFWFFIRRAARRRAQKANANGEKGLEMKSNLGPPMASGGLGDSSSEQDKAKGPAVDVLERTTTSSSEESDPEILLYLSPSLQRNASWDSAVPRETRPYRGPLPPSFRPGPRSTSTSSRFRPWSRDYSHDHNDYDPNDHDGTPGASGGPRSAVV
ncbi:hypothetical protein BP6252_13578 [Coleophoma cylindrospora]|uniref:Uncharacterized protein n=1 Tax=Coleophoma cylindrospora TaxID=1849047 RepID=A0A3D8Q931_9HELO|nr:hypothetical protein BP6252_13578 [Coleophoma cylindrospora]